MKMKMMITFCTCGVITLHPVCEIVYDQFCKHVWHVMNVQHRRVHSRHMAFMYSHSAWHVVSTLTDRHGTCTGEHDVAVGQNSVCVVRDCATQHKRDTATTMATM